MTANTNDVIGALESAKSFYQYRLDVENYPINEAVLFHAEIAMVDQIIANEKEKSTAINTLLQLCESSLELLTPALKDELTAAMQNVRTTLDHKPAPPVDVNSNGRDH